jgi:hypothetical protein
VAYYVLGTGGAKYGPVDIGTLNTWIGQGRVEPGTLLEDVGSGVKSPARAIRGLQFPGGAVPSTTSPDQLLTAPHGTPFTGATPSQPPPDPRLQTTSPRPGRVSGGSASNLFLSSVDSKWAWQGFACVGIAWLSAGIIAATHTFIGFGIGKLLIFALALPVYGALRGVRGLQINRPLAVVIIALNAFGLIGSLAIMLKDLFL